MRPAGQDGLGFSSSLEHPEDVAVGDDAQQEAVVVHHAARWAPAASSASSTSASGGARSHPGRVVERESHGLMVPWISMCSGKACQSGEVCATVRSTSTRESIPTRCGVNDGRRFDCSACDLAAHVRSTGPFRWGSAYDVGTGVMTSTADESGVYARRLLEFRQQSQAKRHPSAAMRSVSVMMPCTAPAASTTGTPLKSARSSRRTTSATGVAAVTDAGDAVIASRTRIPRGRGAWPCGGCGRGPLHEDHALTHHRIQFGEECVDLRCR